VTEKRDRQAFLRRIVAEQDVRSQQELVELLRNAGFEATQTSISRDVREIGLVKLGGRYVPAGSDGSGTTEHPPDPIAALVTHVEPVGANLVVVRTTVGGAGPVAAALDQKMLPAVGTVAGDDTVFIAVRSRSMQGRVIAALREWTHQPQPAPVL
jgi:transcriptional regulator of arginine metabolism